MKFVKACLLTICISLFAVSYASAGGGHGGGGHGGGGHGGHAGGHGGGHGGHSGYGHFHGFYGGGSGFFLYGAPFYGGWGIGPYYYYDTYPPWLNEPSEPGSGQYIEQGTPPGAEPAGAPSWFYCENPRGYYPYVQKCAAPWQRVAPHSPPPRSGSY